MDIVKDMSAPAFLDVGSGSVSMPRTFNCGARPEASASTAVACRWIDTARLAGPKIAFKTPTTLTTSQKRLLVDEGQQGLKNWRLNCREPREVSMAMRFLAIDRLPTWVTVRCLTTKAHSKLGCFVVLRAPEKRIGLPRLFFGTSKCSHPQEAQVLADRMECSPQTIHSCIYDIQPQDYSNAQLNLFAETRTLKPTSRRLLWWTRGAWWGIKNRSASRLGSTSAAEACCMICLKVWTLGQEMTFGCFSWAILPNCRLWVGRWSV